ncbi:ankyrin repeat-containing domain protein [Aspergillus spinulosporus]
MTSDPTADHSSKEPIDEIAEIEYFPHMQNEKNDKEIVQEMCNVSYPRKQEAKLYRAIRKNDISAARNALANGVSPDGGFAKLPSPITLCICYERLEIMRLLFEDDVQSPQPSTSENGFEDELLLAAEKGNVEILMALVEYRETKREYSGFVPGYFDQAEPIHAAARGNKRAPGCMGWLLERGANVNEKIENWRTPLHFAVDQPHARADVVRYLLQKGADVDHENWYGKTPIFIAAERGHGSVVRELLKWNPRLDGKPGGNQWRLEHLHIKWDGVTVLHVAAANCSLRTVKALVGAGADIYARDKERRSILEYARGARRMDTVAWIMEDTTLETLVAAPF